jgi:hypothetical protein
MMSDQHLPLTKQAVQEEISSCTQGHNWHPTIILGYFQCARCHRLAACTACVSRVRGKAMPGYCRAHEHLRTPGTEQEVLG